MELALCVGKEISGTSRKLIPFQSKWDDPTAGWQTAKTLGKAECLTPLLHEVLPWAPLQFRKHIVVALCRLYALA